MRRRQSGQAIVLAAVSLLALTLMLALVLVGGTLYWERRHLQSLADSAALAGANTLSADCVTVMAGTDPKKNPVYAAGIVLAAQLGARTDVSFTGTSCAAGYQAVFTYPDSPYGGTVTATVNYPYEKLDSQIEVLVSALNPLQIGGISPSGSATVGARAVARFQGSSLPGAFALYTSQNLDCGGTQELVVHGSIYVGGQIASGCNVFAHSITNGTTYRDFGDILVRHAYQDWSGGKGSASCAGGTASGNVVCADGLEISGSTPARCAPDLSTMYLDPGEGKPGLNPNPCPNPPPVPALSLNNFLPKEPNTVKEATGTLPGDTPCAVDGVYTSAVQVDVGSNLTVGRARSDTAGVASAIKPDKDGYYHFFPGCYGWLNVGAIGAGKAKAVLEPGLYYFNGSSNPKDGVKGGGLCLAPPKSADSQLVAKDVTLEFVNASSFSVASCDSSPTSAAGSGTASFGSQTVVDTRGLPTGSFDWFSAPTGAVGDWCTTDDCKGLLIWAPPAGYSIPQIQGTFFVKGGSAFYDLRGTIYWPGQFDGNTQGCEVQANAGSQIEGQLLCQSVLIQGGSKTAPATISWVNGGGNTGPEEAGLVE